MTGGAPSALLAQPGRPPRELPAALERPEPLLPAGGAAGPPQPLTLFVTVDVEDSYFDRPVLMSGEGIGREWGVFGILDLLDAHGLKGTFFVNVYERDRQPSGAVERVVREIAARGHEVGLHCHPSKSLEFYHRPLFRLERAAQAEVLRWGAELIGEWTGAPPVSFRGGGYAINDDTFPALREAGIAIDSSCFFPSPNNRNTARSVNSVAAMPAERVEVPVTTVLRVDGGGRLAQRKLDLDWLSVPELASALRTLASHASGFATFMMHSFSFIEKRTRKLNEPPSPRARFVSEDDLDRYVEVFGPKPATRDAFSSFLELIGGEPHVTVRTLRDALPALSQARSDPDVIPIVEREEAPPGRQ